MKTKTQPARRLPRGIAAMVIFAFLTVGFLLNPGVRQSAVAAGQMSQDQLDQKIHDYIMAHPEVLMEALQSLDAKQREADAAEAKKSLIARADDLYRDKQSPIGGNAKGDVTIVEFFDYNCPYCRQMAPVVEQALADDPQVRIVYKEFPILGPDSDFAAKAALAADRQGKYDAFHKALYAVKSRVTEAVVLKVAEEVGLNVTRLKSDMQDAAIQAAIDRNMNLAQALKISGTPSFVVGDLIVPGATDLDTIKKLFQRARKTRK